MEMTRGYFDVDCRELSLDGSWAYRPRVAPIARSVDRLYLQSQLEGAALVSTTCGGGRLPDAANCPGNLFVPLDREDMEWRESISFCRCFHVQKECGSWRTFDVNGNAATLFRELGLCEWIVFGNGLDLCVDHVVENLLSLGLQITFLSDVLIPSATGHGPLGDSGTPQSRERTLARWRDRGARETTLDAFLAACARREAA
jgi:hypothetical protein